MRFQQREKSDGRKIALGSRALYLFENKLMITANTMAAAAGVTCSVNRHCSELWAQDGDDTPPDKVAAKDKQTNKQTNEPHVRVLFSLSTCKHAYTHVCSCLILSWSYGVKLRDQLLSVCARVRVCVRVFVRV